MELTNKKGYICADYKIKNRLSCKVEGIAEVRDVYEEVKHIQIQNLIDKKSREIILLTFQTLPFGCGENVIPMDVLLAVVEMKTGDHILGLIINDWVLFSDDDKFIVSYEGQDLVIVGAGLVDKTEYSYEETVLKNEKN